MCFWVVLPLIRHGATSRKINFSGLGCFYLDVLWIEAVHIDIQGRRSRVGSMQKVNPASGAKGMRTNLFVSVLRGGFVNVIHAHHVGTLEEPKALGPDSGVSVLDLSVLAFLAGNSLGCNQLKERKRTNV